MYSAVIYKRWIFCFFMVHLDDLRQTFMLSATVHICVYCHYPLVAGAGNFLLLYFLKSKH